MPIGASAGTLDIENATLRSNAIAVLTNLVTGNDAVRSSGAPTLEVYGDPSNGGNEARLELVSNLSVENSKSFTRLTSNAGVFSIQSGTDGTTNGPITFGGFSNERMRIAADGNVGIGTDNPGATLDIRGSVSDPSIPTVHIGDNAADLNGDYGMVNLVRNPTESGTKAHLAFIRNGNTVFGQGYYNNTNTFGFWPSFGSVANVPTMSITSAGNVGIGTADPSAKLQVGGNNETAPQYLWIRGNRVNEAGDISGIHFYNSATSGDRGNSRIINSRGTNNYGSNLEFWTNPDDNVPATQKMTILANGSVGIGITNPDSKLEVRGVIQASYSNTDHGVFVENFGNIRRDYGGYGAGFHLTDNKIWAVDYTGTYNDGGIAWGDPNYRWGQIYSTQSTIATSDRNLKQDITDITDSERRVASKIIPLLKTYRMKDAVEKKGDEARTHTGIIAQDLITVFESEGLDAHRYGLLCYDEKWTVDGEHELTETVYKKYGSSEYTNEEGNVVNYTVDDEGVEAVKHKIGIFANKDTPGAILDSTIYSIRYEELLCFIVSAMATEEKVTTLETQLATVLARLDALESA
jgi:hypothetical protein